jgi:hypothetical protein
MGLMLCNLIKISTLKKQHKYSTSAPVGTGSVNMGLVSQKALVGGTTCHLNTNVEKTKMIMENVKKIVFPKILQLFDNIFPEWEISFGKLYRNLAPEVPHMYFMSRSLFYNGFQYHHNHCCSLHNDTNDIRGIPTIIIYLGHVPSILRIHVNGYNHNPIEVITKPGGILLMDSYPLHEVIVEEKNKPVLHAEDGHGSFQEGRNSLVIMANQQFGHYVSQKYASAALSESSKKRRKKMSDTTLNPQVLKKKILGHRPRHRT